MHEASGVGIGWKEWARVCILSAAAAAAGAAESAVEGLQQVAGTHVMP